MAATSPSGGIFMSILLQTTVKGVPIALFAGRPSIPQSSLTEHYNLSVLDNKYHCKLKYSCEDCTFYHRLTNEYDCENLHTLMETDENFKTLIHKSHPELLL